MRSRRLALVPAVIAGLAVFAPALADPDVTPPSWLRRPSDDKLSAFYPARASLHGVDGRAVLVCTVNTKGEAVGCRAKAETPAGMGFGLAAIALSPDFAFRPAMKNGQPVEAEVSVTINFKGPSGPAAPPLGSHLPATERDTGTVAEPLAVIWKRTPTLAAMQTALAGANATSGRVTLRCRMKPDGGLNDCDGLVEEPRGQGLSAAARKLTPLFRVDLAAMPQLIRGDVEITVPFDFDAKAAAGSPAVITRPVWTRQLAADRIQQLFPDKAAKAGLSSGHAVVDCVVGDEGALGDCRTLSEDPAGMDFGAEATRVASAMAIDAWTSEGRPAEGRHVQIGMRLNLAAPDAGKSAGR